MRKSEAKRAPAIDRARAMFHRASTRKKGPLQTSPFSPKNQSAPSLLRLRYPDRRSYCWPATARSARAGSMHSSPSCPRTSTLPRAVGCSPRKKKRTHGNESSSFWTPPPPNFAFTPTKSCQNSSPPNSPPKLASTPSHRLSLPPPQMALLYWN